MYLSTFLLSAVPDVYRISNIGNTQCLCLMVYAIFVSCGCLLYVMLIFFFEKKIAEYHESGSEIFFHAFLSHYNFKKNRNNNV